MINKLTIPFFIALAISSFIFTGCKKNDNTPIPSEFFKTYGGGGADYINTIKPLPDGGFIAVGSTKSYNYIPGTGIDFRNNHGDYDILVIKVDAFGKIIKTTLLGGSKEDRATAITIANDGTIYIAGYTYSIDKDFAGLSKGNGGNADAFVLKLNSDLSLNKAILLGGSNDDEAKAITIANDGTIYLTGYTGSNDIDFMGLTYKGDYDAFVLKLNSDLSINNKTLLGGSKKDIANAITIANDTIYIAGFTGYTGPTDFYGLTPKGNTDAFVLKLNSDLSINNKTLLGGSNYDEAKAIIIPNDSTIYIAGTTSSMDKDFMNITYKGGNTDAFVFKLNNNLTINNKTLLGGSNIDDANAITIANDGKLIGAGYTNSADGDIISSFGNYDVFFFKRSL